jgi:hypothetical protein
MITKSTYRTHLGFGRIPLEFAARYQNTQFVTIIQVRV